MKILLDNHYTCLRFEGFSLRLDTTEKRVDYSFDCLEFIDELKNIVKKDSKNRSIIFSPISNEEFETVICKGMLHLEYSESDKSYTVPDSLSLKDIDLLFSYKDVLSIILNNYIIDNLFNRCK